MVIQFIGTPCSGKSTLAASMFERLKSFGLPSEFIPEAARRFIVEKRQELNMSWKNNPSLSEDDQREIFKRQVGNELLYWRTSPPESILITDSSPFNSLLYVKDTDFIWRNLDKVIPVYKPVIFYCKMVKSGSIDDPNRIHSREFSESSEEYIPGIIQEIQNRYGIIPVTVDGSRERRANDTYWAIMDKYKSF